MSNLPPVRKHKIRYTGSVYDKIERGRRLEEPRRPAKGYRNRFCQWLQRRKDLRDEKEDLKITATTIDLLLIETIYGVFNEMVGKGEIAFENQAAIQFLAKWIRHYAERRVPFECVKGKLCKGREQESEAIEKAYDSAIAFIDNQNKRKRGEVEEGVA